MSKTASILAFKALDIAQHYGLGFGFKRLQPRSPRLNGWVGPRPQLETDPSFLQPIPYVVVSRMRNEHEREYLTYARGGATNEGRLRGKVSIGVGGHVDAEHLTYLADGSIDEIASIYAAAIRELEEEIGTVPGQLELKGLIQVYDSDVDKVHVGFLMHCDATQYFENGEGKLTFEDGIDNVEWRVPFELGVNGNVELEAWSKVALDQF